MVSPAAPADGSELGTEPSSADAVGAEAPAVPVVIACSTEDQSAADNAAGGLRERGFRVEVVGEAESLPHRLDEVVGELEGQGLYVLCRGGTLDRDGIDGLREMLREREVPFGRTLTLATGHGGARALEERIVSVARRMVTGRFEQVPEPPKTGTSAEPPAATDEPEAPAAPLAPGVDESDVDRWADSLAHGERVSLEEDSSASGEAFPVDAELSDAGDEPDPADEDAFYERIDKTLVSLSPDTDPIPAAQTAAFEDAESGTTTEPTSAEPPPQPASIPEAPVVEDTEYTSFDGGNMRLFVGGAAATMITIALIAYFASGTDEPEEKASDKAEVVADAKEPGAGDGDEAVDKPVEKTVDETAEKAGSLDRPADQDPAGSAEDAKEASVDAEPSDEKPEAAAVPVKAGPAPEDTPPEEPAPVAEAEAPEPAAPADAPAEVSAGLAELAALDTEAAERALAHRSHVDPALLADAELPPGAPGEDAVVAAALNDREVRAWNVFLLAGDDAPAMSFSDAETFCKTLTVADVAGWRLPSIGELSSLSGAKMLGKSVFWSETPGDAFGDTRMVLNGRKGSMSSVRADWDGAKPICVRVRS